MADEKTPTGDGGRTASASEPRPDEQGESTSGASDEASTSTTGQTTEKPADPTPEKATDAGDKATDDKATDDKATDDKAADDKDAEKPRKRVTRDRDTGRDKDQKGAGQKVVAGANAVRSRIASLVWLVAVVCALFLAVGALLVALKANHDNAIVKFVLDAADALDLDVFGRRSGIFTFHGKDAATKGALVNWGIGAIAYLVVGKVADRIIRP